MFALGDGSRLLCNFLLFIIAIMEFSMGQRLFEPDTLNLHPVILDFARNLRGARMKLKLSQKELADASGLTQAALSRYERGVILPKLPSMIALADVLGIPLWLLLKPERLDSLSE